MQKTESIKNIMTALGAFQEEAIKIKKDTKNPFFKSKYASLSTILDEIQPTLTKCKLSFTQLPEGSEYLETILCHWETGETITSKYKLNCVHTLPPEWAKIAKEFPADMIPKDLSNLIITPQSLGSAITYARRYALTSILGLNIDDDDDGNLASGNNAQPQQQAQPQPNNKASQPQPQAQQQPQQLPPQQAPITPFNKKYTDINAIIAVIDSAAQIIDLNMVYHQNRELCEANPFVIDKIKSRRLAIENHGKIIITNNQFDQVCSRITKGEIKVMDNAINTYILNQGQIERMQFLVHEFNLLEESLKLKYSNEADIDMILTKCQTSEQVLRLHQNNSMIIDRTPELQTKVNGRLKVLKAV
jgi:hypothetical protein